MQEVYWRKLNGVPVLWLNVRLHFRHQNTWYPKFVLLFSGAVVPTRTIHWAKLSICAQYTCTTRTASPTPSWGPNSGTSYLPTRNLTKSMEIPGNNLSLLVRLYKSWL
jgi:hypothetical protein